MTDRSKLERGLYKKNLVALATHFRVHSDEIVGDEEKLILLGKSCYQDYLYKTLHEDGDISPLGGSNYLPFKKAVEAYDRAVDGLLQECEQRVLSLGSA